MTLKKDNLTLGVLLGLVLPFVVAAFLYFLKFSNYSVAEFFATIRRESRLITFFAAWCMVANIGLFTLFINTNKYQTSKGIFFITLVYGVAFLLLRMLG